MSLTPEEAYRRGSGQRYNAQGFDKTFGRSTDGETTDEERPGDNRPRKKKQAFVKSGGLRQQLESGKQGVFAERPISSRREKRPVSSYYFGIPTLHHEKPGFSNTSTGVPTSSKTGVGYYFPNDKADDARPGKQCTVWYYYDQNDGPHSDLRFGDAIPKTRTGGQPFWVSRVHTEDGQQMTPAIARTIVFDHPEKNRARSLPLGFRFETKLKVQPGTRFSRKVENHGGYATDASSGEDTPKRQMPPARKVNPKVSFASVASSGASSAASTRAHSRASSPPPGPARSFGVNPDDLKNLLRAVVREEFGSSLPSTKGSTGNKNQGQSKKEPKDQKTQGETKKKDLFQTGPPAGAEPAAHYGFVSGNSAEHYRAMRDVLPHRALLQYAGAYEVKDGMVHFHAQFPVSLLGETQIPGCAHTTGDNTMFREQSATTPAPIIDWSECVDRDIPLEPTPVLAPKEQRPNVTQAIKPKPVNKPATPLKVSPPPTTPLSAKPAQKVAANPSPNVPMAQSSPQVKIEAEKANSEIATAPALFTAETPAIESKHVRMSEVQQQTL